MGDFVPRVHRAREALNQGNLMVALHELDTAINDDRTVWVTIHSHKHGTDYELHSTKEDAQAYIGSILHDQRDDLFTEEARKKLSAALDAELWSQAMQIWHSNSDEYFEITPRTV